MTQNDELKETQFFSLLWLNCSFNVLSVPYSYNQPELGASKGDVKFEELKLFAHFLCFS